MSETQVPKGGIWPTSAEVLARESMSTLGGLRWDPVTGLESVDAADFDRYADGTYVDPKNDPPEHVNANRMGLDRFDPSRD